MLKSKLTKFVAPIPVLLAYVATAPGAQPPQATQNLLDANPGLRAMYHGERMVALYGVPFAEDALPGTTTDDFVEDFLQNHRDALGVADVELVLVDKINIRDGKFAVYTYAQEMTDQPSRAGSTRRDTTGR